MAENAFIRFFQPQATCVCCGESYFHALKNGLCDVCSAHIGLAPSGDLRAGLAYGGDDLDGAFSLFKYGDSVRAQVHALKYGAVRSLGLDMGREMAQKAGDLPFEPDALIPVPLHWTRHLRRGYNQALALAQGVAETTGWHIDDALLARRKRTGKNATLSHASRLENVLGAFALKGDARGKRLLLIDDVLTTGSTVSQCARTLKDGGAAWVGVLTYARAGGSGGESDSELYADELHV